jgi:hypothetical protein
MADVVGPGGGGRKKGAVRIARRALGALLAALFGAALLAPAALADSEVPPTHTTSRTSVVILVGIGVLVLVLLSVEALRTLARARRARWSESESAGRRTQASSPPADVEEPADGARPENAQTIPEEVR